MKKGDVCSLCEGEHIECEVCEDLGVDECGHSRKGEGIEKCDNCVREMRLQRCE